MGSESRIISASANISGRITFVILGAISGSFMLLFLLQLFLFSTTESRKRPVFYLSTASSLINPGVTQKAYTAVINLMLLFSPIPVGAILLLRIVAVYHPRSLLYLLPLPIALNVARVINMVVAICLISTRPWNFVLDWNHLAFPRVEWMLQLVINVYVSGVFLYRLRSQDIRRRNINGNINHKGKPLSRTSILASELSRTCAVIQRMRAAWLIATSNFVIPCILQVIQVGVVFHGRTKGQSEEEWFNECSFMMIVNGYVVIVGVVFATVWAGANNWAMKEGAFWARIQTTPISATTPSSATSPYKLNPISEEETEY
ncbi:hypothetical protein B0H13DRAFT_1852352 [Mycena leptocephala]|nr:hypothetical protein B0H13DRAFT_1852352 [Mycena leptocephala]